jgi:hypothetical protein
MKLLALLFAGVAGLTAATAHADVSAAARAYSDGQAAQIEGNYERAAQSYELAFHIAPSREALRSAVRARMLGNQLPRAATLAQLLLTLYPDDAESAKLASEVIAEARGRLARITVACARPCTVAIGGRAISLDAAVSHIVFTPPGRQSLEVTFDGDHSVARDVTVRAGETVTLPIEPPAPTPGRPAHPTPAPVHEPPRALSPSFTLGAGAVTLILASITTWSALDTVTAHDAYAAAPSPEGWKDGRSKQLRTNLLLGTTAAAGIATTLIAVFWTRWDAPHDGPPDVAIAPTSGGLSVSLGGRF